MKIGDLVRFFDAEGMITPDPGFRGRGIIISFDKDDDPMVMWLDSSFFMQPEENYRKHIVVLSES